MLPNQQKLSIENRLLVQSHYPNKWLKYGWKALFGISNAASGEDIQIPCMGAK